MISASFPLRSALLATLLLLSTLLGAQVFGHGGDYSVYILHQDASYVTVVKDAGLGDEIQTRLSVFPAALAISSDGEIALFSDSLRPAIEVLRTDSGRIHTSLYLPSHPPTGAESSGEGARGYDHSVFDWRTGSVWASLADDGVVHRFEMWQSTFTDAIDVAGSPGFLAMAGRFGKVFAFDRHEAEIAVISVAARTVFERIPLRAPAVDVVGAAAERVYYILDADGQVARLSTIDGAVEYLAQFGAGTSRLAYSQLKGSVLGLQADGRRVVGINVDKGVEAQGGLGGLIGRLLRLASRSPQVGDVVLEYDLPAPASDLAVSPDGHHLYLTLPSLMQLLVVDLEELVLERTVQLDAPPLAVEVVMGE